MNILNQNFCHSTQSLRLLTHCREREVVLRDADAFLHVFGCLRKGLDVEKPTAPRWGPTAAPWAWRLNLLSVKIKHSHPLPVRFVSFDKFVMNRVVLINIVSG